MRWAIAVVIAVVAACSFRTNAASSDGAADTQDGSGSGGGGGGGGSAWAYKRQLTIDNSGLAALADFPLEVILNGSRVRLSAAGADLRFTDASDTQLAFEIESWSTTATSYVWVRVPTIAAATTTTLWMYYGNPSASDGQMPAAVWDAQYVGVWHLADAHDSTGHNASTNSGATAQMMGEVGPALHFDGTHEIDTKSNDHLTTFTLEAWANPSGSSMQQTPSGSSIVARFDNYLMLWNCNQTVFCHSVLFNGQNSGSNGTYTAAYTPMTGGWHHYAGTYDGAKLLAFHDGVKDNTASTNDTPNDPAATARIGSQGGGSFFVGDIDEVRISSVARSQDYLEATVRAANDMYITIGAEQAN